MQPVGFEPTPPERLLPESSALDHSAKTATDSDLCLCTVCIKYLAEAGFEPAPPKRLGP